MNVIFFYFKKFFPTLDKLLFLLSSVTNFTVSLNNVNQFVSSSRELVQTMLGSFRKMEISAILDSQPEQYSKYSRAWKKAGKHLKKII